MGLGDNLDSEIERFLSQALQKTAATRLDKFLEGYRLSAQSEGKSPSTIAIVVASVRYLDQFLTSHNLSTNVTEIGVEELRRFIVYLRERPRFARHRFTKPQGGHLSGHTINGYLRALQAFWSWLASERLARRQKRGLTEEQTKAKRLISCSSSMCLDGVGGKFSTPWFICKVTIQTIVIPTEQNAKLLPQG